MSDEDTAAAGHTRIDASQVYFWTQVWQNAEREAQADIRAGRTKTFKSVNDLIADLER